MCLINNLAIFCLLEAILCVCIAEQQLNENAGISSNLQSELAENRRRRDTQQKSENGGFAFDGYPDDEMTKRMRDFVGKRTLDEGFEMDKKLRDFVGKRMFPEEEMDKRMRDFVGKRSMDEYLEDEKRSREFVGKRSDPFEYDLAGYGDYEKRMRDFVGKRWGGAYFDEPAKRVRDFVGKRSLEEYPVIYLGPRPIRRPKYVRELVGKRSMGFPLYGSAYDLEKRVRDFVGK